MQYAARIAESEVMHEHYDFAWAIYGISSAIMVFSLLSVCHSCFRYKTYDEYYEELEDNVIANPQPLFYSYNSSFMSGMQNQNHQRNLSSMNDQKHSSAFYGKESRANSLINTKTSSK